MYSSTDSTSLSKNVMTSSPKSTVMTNGLSVVGDSGPVTVGVGAIVSTINDSVFAQTLDGLSGTLRAAGYELLLTSSNYDPDVEEDALRRDFTINALFLDPVSGEIRDYVGGYQDLADRRLVLIGDPEVRYREDPVRLLRAARFEAKLGVKPDEASEEMIPKLSHLLADVQDVCDRVAMMYGGKIRFEPKPE